MTDEKTLRVVALRVLLDEFKAQYDKARAELAEEMSRGDRRIARSPLGDETPKLAAVSKTDPAHVASIVDEDAFKKWVAATYPEKITSDYEVCGSPAEVHRVLFEHAPHLLRRVSKVDPQFRQLVLTRSKTSGMPVSPFGELDVPGVEVRLPDAQVTCRPTENALADVIELFRANRLSVEHLSNPQLPGGAA